MKTEISRTMYLILLVVAVFVVLIKCKQCKSDNIEIVNDLYVHADDSLRYYKNKYGAATASISVLQGEHADDLLKIKSSNSTVIWLQSELGKYKSNIKNGGTIGVIGTNTSYTSTSTTTVSPVNIGDSLPTYTSNNKDTTWIKYSIISNKDSTTLELKVKNKYTLVVGEEKVGLFKRKPVAFITNQNPYTQVTEMKIYNVTNKVRKRVSISIQGGYGIGLFNIKPQPYVGIGVGYNLLNLW